MMNSRDRWLACMRFEPVDHIPDEEFGYWDETLPAWHEQGLPLYVDSMWKADVYFGFESHVGVPIGDWISPPFEMKVLNEDESHRTIIDLDGVTKTVYKDGSSAIPHFVRFPIETREDWRVFAKRLDPDEPARYPDEAGWQSWTDSVSQSGKVVEMSCGSLFGRLRDWMGFENIAMACMDDPVWVEEMIEHCADFHYRIVKRSLDRVGTADVGAFWEDMAFNHGPIISPALFEKWLMPRYKRITDLLGSYGCDFAYVDCDGNINSIVEYWLEGGVNIMFPIEIRGGTDPRRMRDRFGKQVLLAGGVDKTQLIAGKEAIDKEIERIKPLVEEGGYVPHVDHRCPPDVTFENYQYYLRRKREACGIPEPRIWKERMGQYEWAVR